jgi:signal peptidase II
LFVENKGMAMGTKFNDILPFIEEDSAKLFLTLFRLIAILGLGYWLLDSIKKNSPILLSCALALIFAGALGNIIDSVFYGFIFSDSYNSVATLFPLEGGYAPLFYGHVVDMLQFPLVEWTWPKWVPVLGGDTFLFFQYIFNIADTAISTGVGILIVFNKKIFKEEPLKTIESFEE